MDVLVFISFEKGKLCYAIKSQKALNHKLLLLYATL